MLPEFANGRALATAPSFGSSVGRGDQVGEVLADIGRDHRPGTMKLKFSRQLISDQGKIQRSAVREKPGQKIAGFLGPGSFVVTP